MTRAPTQGLGNKTGKGGREAGARLDRRCNVSKSGDGRHVLHQKIARTTSKRRPAGLSLPRPSPHVVGIYSRARLTLPDLQRKQRKDKRGKKANWCSQCPPTPHTKKAFSVLGSFLSFIGVEPVTCILRKMLFLVFSLGFQSKNRVCKFCRFSA